MAVIIVLLTLITLILGVLLLLSYHTMKFYRKRCDNLLNAHAKRLDHLRDYCNTGFTLSHAAVKETNALVQGIQSYLRDIKALDKTGALNPEKNKDT